MALKNDVISQYVAERSPKQETVIDESLVDRDASLSAPKIDGRVAANSYLNTSSPKIDLSIIPKYADVNPFANENKGFYSTMYGQLFGDNAPETQEEKAKREKRDRTRSVIAALGDGLSSIANIWGTTQGATPMNLASLSEANRKRYDYADNIRRKNEDAWKHGLLQARMSDMNLRRQDAAINAQAAKWRQDQEYKYMKDARDFLAKREDEKNKQAQQQYQNSFAEKKQEEQVRHNTVVEGIGRTNANTAIRRESNRGAGATKEPKMAQFSIGNGDTVSVPDEKKYAFTADVYKKLSEASLGSESPILKFYSEQIKGSVPNSVAMMNTVNYFIGDFPEVQEFMFERARQYRENLPNEITPKTPSTPGSPSKANVPVSKDVSKKWEKHKSK